MTAKSKLRLIIDILLGRFECEECKKREQEALRTEKIDMTDITDIKLSRQSIDNFSDLAQRDSFHDTEEELPSDQ